MHWKPIPQGDYGKEFSGLTASQFNPSVTGTSWRRRTQLPGRVARILSVGTPYAFISVPIYGWPVVFFSHRERREVDTVEKGAPTAKYTIELNEDFVCYGFYIERNHGPMDTSRDWPRLMAALRSDRSLLDVIAQAEQRHGARFVGRMSVGEKYFHYANGLDMGAQSLWDEERAASYSVVERLNQLDDIPEDY